MTLAIIQGAARRPLFPRCVLCGAEAPSPVVLAGSTIHPECVAPVACSVCDLEDIAASLDPAGRCRECQP